MLALDGITILDLSGGAPGPFCTMILGDLGADVIRIDVPAGAGRLGRSATPEEQRKNITFQYGRNKKSIALNLRTEAARQVFYDLAQKSDVIVEGFRPGAVESLGVDYKTIKKINPRIIYCSITSYGQDGPYRDLIAHDVNCIAMAGALGLIGEKDGRPAIPLNLLADHGGSGMCAAVGILSAVIARGKTGKGQYIDISMQDSTVLLLAFVAAHYLRTNIVPTRGDNMSGGGYPYYAVYKTSDGKYISLGNFEPWLWESFCKEIGREDFIPYHYEDDHIVRPPDDPKWKEIRDFLTRLFLTKTRDEWFETLSRKRVFVGKVNSLDEALADPQVRHRNMVVEMDHPTYGKIKQVGIAIKLQDTPGEVRSAPRLPGEDTNKILADLGYSKQKIGELRKEGAIG